MSEHADTSNSPLAFEQVRRVNASRCARWHPPDWTEPSDPWTLADWSNALCGEAGEAANIVKNLRRMSMTLVSTPSDTTWATCRTGAFAAWGTTAGRTGRLRPAVVPVTARITSWRRSNAFG